VHNAAETILGFSQTAARMATLPIAEGTVNGLRVRSAGDGRQYGPAAAGGPLLALNFTVR